MLSSIHPLGERARQGNWWVAVSSFAITSTAAGAAVGWVAGWIGSLLVRWSAHTQMLSVGLTMIVAALLEFARVPVPSSHRQVNERWIGAYRSWVYGGGFGLQLGTGFLTHVVTWAVPAVFLAELLLANPGTGALVGAAFGGGRWLLLGAAGWIDRPSRLSRFTAILARWAAPAAWVAPVVLLGLGSTVMLLGWGGATQ
jgi:preprotein translocase subunit SecG